MARNSNAIRRTRGERIGHRIICIVLGLFALSTVYPAWHVLMYSISDSKQAMSGGFFFWPRGFSLKSYELVFKTNQIWVAYRNSLLVMLCGTLLSVALSALTAYPLSRKRLHGRNFFSMVIFFTMLFSGGLVPSYMLISRYLHMKDSIWVLIIPILINPWNMFLLRNFFTSIPASMAESARIDGANDFTIMWKIILPCATPALATIGLFYALAYWNNWFQALMYIDKSALKPLQAIIMEMLRNTEFLKQMAGQIGISSLDLPTTTSKMATAMVTIGPIVLVYPFVQKYFTSGIMVGSVKG